MVAALPDVAVTEAEMIILYLSDLLRYEVRQAPVIEGEYVKLIRVGDGAAAGACSTFALSHLRAE